MTFRFALTSAAALALAACGSNDAVDDRMTDEATATETAATIDVPTPEVATPQSFVDTLAASDMFEIAAAKLARDLGKSDKVKAFAAMMVKDHTASSDKLKAAVAEAGDTLTVAPALTPLQQGDLDQLRGAGDNFDAMYAQQQLHAHEAALALLQAQAQSGTVEQLKTFASETTPVVEDHLERARQLP
jgi:putative membrane protein